MEGKKGGREIIVRSDRSHLEGGQRKREKEIKMRVKGKREGKVKGNVTEKDR